MSTTPLRDDPVGEPLLEEPSLKSRFLGKRSALSFLLALGILVFFASRLELDFEKTWNLMRSANPALFLAAFLVYYFTFPLRGGRWRLLLLNTGLTKEAGVHLPSPFRLGLMVFMSWFANCVIPAKLGDAYRGYQLKRASGVSFSVAMGTVVAERFIDIVVLVLLLTASVAGIGGLGQGEGASTVNIFAGGILLLALGIAGLGTMWALRDKVVALLPVRLKSKYVSFQESAFGSFKNLPIVFVISVGVWLGETLRLFLVVNALGISISLPFAIFLALANSLLTVVPFTPGGLGLAEAGTTGLLMLGGVEKELAVAAALLDRMISYWSIIFFGFVVLLIRRQV